VLYEAYIWSGLFDVFFDVSEKEGQYNQELSDLIFIPIRKSLDLVNEQTELLENYGGRRFMQDDAGIFNLMLISEAE
jgi:hypothetical protein